MRRTPFVAGRAPAVPRRAVLAAVALLLLAAVVGLTSHLNRDERSPAKSAPPRARSVHRAPAPDLAPSPPHRGSPLPLPPSTRDPLAYGKATAVALWSYDTRLHSHDEQLAALRRWMTSEKKYADAASVDTLVPSPVLWKEMAEDGQYATATAADARFPASFTQAMQQDPGAITTAYVYAVTVTGRQMIAWKDTPRGGTEARAVTLAVQCRPGHDCALAGVLPNVAP